MILAIIALFEMGIIDLISSEVLLFENRRATNPSRKEFALEVLNKAGLFVRIDDKIKKRAKQIAETGILPLDALHLASAESIQADYFCTCDDKLLKKAKPLCEPGLKVVSPIQFLEEMEQ